MSRTPLSFYSSYYIDTKVDPSAVTNHGGIFPYLDVMLLVELPKLVSERLPKRGMRGWQHAEHVAALLALNLTGGDCVDDLVKVDGDPGMCLYMGQIARAVGAENRQFSRGVDRNIPSLRSVREWLDQFHNADEDAKRGYGQAFVPEANEALSGLRGVNREFVSRGFRLYQRSGRTRVTRATLERDGSYMQTQKRDALACYKHFDKNGRLDYEVAEVPFVSNAEALIKAQPYRHIVVRRKAKQGILPHLGTNDTELADEETMEMGGYGLPCACDHLEHRGRMVESECGGVV